MPVETLLDALARSKVAVVAAHFDDEVIGAGTLMRRLKGMTLVHITDGAPAGGGDARANGFENLRDYAAARRRELDDALQVAGVSANHIELGCADQEASLRLPWLARQLREVFGGVEIVITHPFEGGHPDHDATAFAAWAACRMMGKRAPVLAEMTSYHNSPVGIETGLFMGETGEQLALTDDDRELKLKMLACFTTQAQTLRCFGVDAERFRKAPAYDFSRPAHPGTLFYEQFDWGMSQKRFTSLAREAIAELGLGGER